MDVYFYDCDCQDSIDLLFKGAFGHAGEHLPLWTKSNT